MPWSRVAGGQGFSAHDCTPVRRQRVIMTSGTWCASALFSSERIHGRESCRRDGRGLDTSRTIADEEDGYRAVKRRYQLAPSPVSSCNDLLCVFNS